jgi:DNA-binding transcriptional ArsR family regulator
MNLQPFEGRGYVKVGIRKAVLEGELASWPDAEVAVLVSLVSHLGKEGAVFPSVIRIAIFAGVSKTTASQALKGLEQRGLIKIKPRRRGRMYLMEVPEDSEAIFIKIGVIWNGLWASCTHTAQRLYLFFLANSRPGDGRGGSALTMEEWKDAVEESTGSDGLRHVLPRDVEPSTIRRLCNIASRTYRDAKNLLMDRDLIRSQVEYDAWQIPNEPIIWMPEVIRAVEAARLAESRPSSGAIQSLRSRRKRRENLAERVPSRGNPPCGEGNPPDPGGFPPSVRNGESGRDCA